jgi:hypothetical protein
MTMQKITVYEYVDKKRYYYSLRSSQMRFPPSVYFACDAMSATTERIALQLGIPKKTLTVVRAKKGKS